MKKVWIIIFTIIAVIVFAGTQYVWHTYHKFMSVETVQYDPQLLILIGGGGNSIVLTSEDGAKAVVVDTKMRAAAKKVRSSVTAGDITVINTHVHGDHTGGNDLFTNAKIIAGAYTQEQWKDGTKQRYPDETVKPGEDKKIQVGSETVHIRNMGRAHTWDDVVVYLEKRKMLVTGDVVFITMHPALFTRSGASISSWIAVLDTLSNTYDIEKLVPGHGSISDKNALAAMKEYFVSIGESIGDQQKQDSLKRKYAGYFSIPGMSSFEATLKFIENERKNR